METSSGVSNFRGIAKKISMQEEMVSAKKGKQPIAYFFTAHRMSAGNLTGSKRQIIMALKEIGPSVIATICDRYPAKFNAISDLIKETPRDNARRNRMFGFNINGDEVIPLYDHTYLLKDVENNFFFNQNVKFR